MSQERDTHFQNFAKLLFDELHARYHGIDIGGKQYYEEQVAEYERIIARRAFDFANYVIKHLHGSNLDFIKVMGLARFLEEYGEQIGYERIPDMDKWPE